MLIINIFGGVVLYHTVCTVLCSKCNHIRPYCVVSRRFVETITNNNPCPSVCTDTLFALKPKISF